ncbi:glycoside hydrolase family 13 protein [Granulicella aggregans]|uniref:glycoside hydrolase family 13 protein n=1 Tax=Granulicella aggregans TaxID=474949 RepID=UPI0021E09D88|nr:alpha-glucosidase [Granulicella aggregans]
MSKSVFKIAGVLSLACLLGGLNQSKEALAQGAPVAQVNGYEPKWWKEAVVYQIYPRSFKDSNGDGIGDLNGITEKLDYLQKLGVNVIWLSPHYDSPNADNGYDIRDYEKVMKEFGTMADFDKMLAGIKQRHMRLIIDLVVNHTSDEHKWFVESAKSKTNPYRDYYIWRDGKPNPAAPNGFDPPNNYPSFFSGSAWQYSAPTKQFYLHLFAVKQPDLNWENPKVRESVYSLMRFWLDKGVDGFRMDVIPLISKQPGLPDLAPGTDYVKLWANGPHRDEYLQEMNKKALSAYDTMTVGEAIGITLEEEPKIIDDSRHELNLVFNFDAMRISRGDGYSARKWTLPQFKAIYTNHANVLGKTSWDTVFLSNHDAPRVVSTFGDDSAEFRVPSAKLLETMILTLRGTPFLYEGDELGMTNYPFTKLSQFDDIEVKNAYKAKVLTGKMTEAEFIAGAHQFGRDNSRTPMQWDATSNGGFTTGDKPWLAVNPNYKEINAASEVADKDSVFAYTQQLIALHHAHKALVYGDYKDLDPENEKVFAYTRTLGDEKFLVVLNFGGAATQFTLPDGLTPSSLVLSNLPAGLPDDGGTLKLRPWETRIYRY